MLDIKIDIGTGKLGFEKSTLGVVKDNEAIIQRIVALLNIRSGELIYNTDYGLDHNILWFSNGNIRLIREHVRNQILKYFNKYIKSLDSIIANFDNTNNERGLNIDIYATLYNDEKLEMKGVSIGG